MKHKSSEAETGKERPGIGRGGKLRTEEAKRETREGGRTRRL